MPSATAAARPGRGSKAQAPAGYARQHAQRAVEELKQFVRIPSVSGQPARASDVRACGQWLADHLRQLGLERVSLIDTPRHPLVFAEWCQATGRPTVLIYGHYDVQPADPESQWRTPPFEPTVQDNDLLGRGACDDKGQLFTHVKAIEAFLRTTGKLPVNVKCLFEGEEEIGSPNLLPFIDRNRRALAADVAVMSDTRMLGPGRPALTYSLRGGLGMELTVHGPKRDLHSGNFGGAIHNPLQALSEILSRLHDRQGRVTVPGFYDRVRSWPAAERTEMARTGPRDAEILRDAGAARGWGERGFSLYERTTIRPALTINGIQGGYRGPGGKAVIPAQASAKISFRLVPDQDPRQIERQVREHLRSLMPPTVRCEIATQMMARPALVDRRHPVMRAAALAYRRGFGALPVFVRSGGTIPVVNTFQQLLGVPTVLMGFALPDDRIHAPNEKFHLPNFHSGIRTSLEFLAEVAEQLGATMIVDCHCHAGRGDRLTAPWNTHAPLETYLRRARAAGIQRTVILPAGHSNYAEANREIGQIVKSHPGRFIGFASVHAVRDAGRVHELVREAVTRLGLRGLKVHCYDAPPNREICEAVRKFGIPVLVDVVGRAYLVELFAQQYPDVNFIIPHFGSFVDDWRAQQQVVDQLVRFPNVYADTAGVRRFDFIVQGIRRAGPRKVLFGSDGPWLHPSVELHKIRMLRLSSDDEALVLGGNVLRLVGRQLASRSHLSSRIRQP